VRGKENNRERGRKENFLSLSNSRRKRSWYWWWVQLYCACFTLIYYLFMLPASMEDELLLRYTKFDFNQSLNLLSSLFLSLVDLLINVCSPRIGFHAAKHFPLLLLIWVELQHLSFRSVRGAFSGLLWFCFIHFCCCRLLIYEKLITTVGFYFILIHCF
jgi:hypothetical protein